MVQRVMTMLLSICPASVCACLLIERVFEAAFVPNGIMMKEKHGTNMYVRQGLNDVVKHLWSVGLGVETAVEDITHLRAW